MRLKIEEIVSAVNGVLHQLKSTNTEITQVEFDTRKVVEGTLFVPLKGNRDGHDFIETAFENGAALTLSDHILEEDVPYIFYSTVLHLSLKRLQDFQINL